MLGINAVLKLTRPSDPNQFPPAKSKRQYYLISREHVRAGMPCCRAVSKKSSQFYSNSCFQGTLIRSYTLRREIATNLGFLYRFVEKKVALASLHSSYFLSSLPLFHLLFPPEWVLLHSQTLPHWPAHLIVILTFQVQVKAKLRVSTSITCSSILLRKFLSILFFLTSLRKTLPPLQTYIS